MMESNSLAYKNIKVIKTKLEPFQGFSGDQDGFVIDDEEFDVELVSDDEGTMDYTDGVSECSTQCEPEDIDTETDITKLFIKKSVDRNLPNNLKLETDFIDD